MFTDIIGIDPYIYTILFLLWSKRVTQYDTSLSLLLLQVFVLLSGEMNIDLVKHLVLEKSEKNCAQRFDDSMSSFSNEKEQNLTT